MVERKVYIQISLSPSVRHLRGSIYIFSQVSTITFNVWYMMHITVSNKKHFIAKISSYCLLSVAMNHKIVWWNLQDPKSKLLWYPNDPSNFTQKLQVNDSYHFMWVLLPIQNQRKNLDNLKHIPQLFNCQFFFQFYYFKTLNNDWS